MKFNQYYTNLWVLKNPAIIYRVTRGFLRAFLLKKNTLKTIELYPTFECQSKCQMCSVEKYKNTARPTLSLADYDLISAEGAKMGAIAMTLLGGEPLLASNVEEITSIFSRRHYFVSMVSNSIDISVERVRRLKKAGLNSIYFSLESFDSATNDAVRGYGGHHDSVMRAIEICKAENMLVGLCGVIFPGKMDRYLELLKFCKKNDLLASGGEVAAVGAAENEPLVSDEEHQEIMRLLQTHPRLTFDWALSYFLKHRCPAGKEKIGITCFGDVIGCSLNPISFGNVMEESVESIWQRMGKFSQIKAGSERCLTAGNRHYINTFIVPIGHSETNPVHFRNHPNMTPDKEPDLYR